MPTTITLTGPGTATLVDDAASAIALHTQAYVAESAKIITQLTNLNNNLIANTQAVNLVSTTMELNFGPLGQLDPGSAANSLKVSAATLGELGKVLNKIDTSLSAGNSAASIIAYSVAGVSAAVTEANSINQLALVDQMEKNSFEKAATKEALTRAGLPEPSPPPVTETLKTTVSNATVINQTTEAISFVEGTFQKGLTYVSTQAVSFFTQASFGDIIATKWASFYDWAIGRPQDVANKIASDASLTGAQNGIPPNTGAGYSGPA
jgi:hypothetical protein